VAPSATSITAYGGRLMQSEPRVALTMSANGNDEGFECSSREEAATKAAEWIRGIPVTETGVDFRVYIELLPEKD
jgi:hypothetical protein